MKTVKENLSRKKHEISFTKQTDGKIQRNDAKIVNPFDNKLEYKANMFLMKYTKWLLQVSANSRGVRVRPNVALSYCLNSFDRMGVQIITLLIRA